MKDQANRSFRILQWIVFGFGLLLTAFGAWIWWTGGRQDAAGVLGGFFLFGGLSVAILSLPKPRWWKD